MFKVSRRHNKRVRRKTSSRTQRKCVSRSVPSSIVKIKNVIYLSPINKKSKPKKSKSKYKKNEIKIVSIYNPDSKKAIAYIRKL